MLNFILQNQILILFACSLFSLLLGSFVLTIKFPSSSRKQTLAGVEFSTALLMLFDALSYLYRGNTTETGYYMVRVSNGIVFAMILFNTYFLSKYITAIFMETGKFKKIPTLLSAGSIISVIGLVFVFLNLFNGMYYTFDEFNRYSRAPLYPLSIVFPFLVSIVLSIFSYRHKHLTKDRLLLSSLLFIVLPIIATLIQLFIYGLSLINFAIFVAASLFFWLCLSDLNKELTQAANTDTMTKLPNSYGFVKELNEIRKRSDLTKYNAYYLDIAKMQVINNRYTKEIGDDVIVEYAKELKKFIDKDEIISRLGGNFFTALIKKENTYKFLEKLSDTEVSFKVHGKKEVLHLLTIAGIYEIYDNSVETGKIINYISTAITYAKNNINKPYAYMNREIEEEINREKELQISILRGLDREEFEPFYQPKVDSNTNTLCGAEALARWRKDGGFVSPAIFIPYMEKTGSICKLDFMMLNHLCKDIRKWIDEGYNPVPVSINFSRRNLDNVNLAEDINKVIERYHIPKELIQIEITETNDDYSIDVLKNFIEGLKKYKLSSSIDDFGSGSSSLNLLNQVKFDVLKVDKVLVDNLDNRSLKILTSIINLAKDLNMSLVAEGVEKKEQLNILNKLGCNVIQGYYYDKPLNKLDFENRLVNKEYHK